MLLYQFLQYCKLADCSTEALFLEKVNIDNYLRMFDNA